MCTKALVGRYVCCSNECDSSFEDMSALRRHLKDGKHPALGSPPGLYRIKGNRSDTVTHSWTCTGKHQLELRWNSAGKHQLPPLECSLSHISADRS